VESVNEASSALELSPVKRRRYAVRNKQYRCYKLHASFQIAEKLPCGEHYRNTVHLCTSKDIKDKEVKLADRYALLQQYQIPDKMVLF
jgi:hypothetical protein